LNRFLIFHCNLFHVPAKSWRTAKLATVSPTDES
jgi:hypothetical protein